MFFCDVWRRWSTGMNTRPGTLQVIVLSWDDSTTEAMLACRIDSWFQRVKSWKLMKIIAGLRCVIYQILRNNPYWPCNFQRCLMVDWKLKIYFLCGHPVSNIRSIPKFRSGTKHPVIASKRFEKSSGLGHIGHDWSTFFWLHRSMRPRYFANEERLKTRWPAKKWPVTSSDTGGWATPLPGQFPWIIRRSNGTEVFETKSEKNQQVAAESPRHNSEKQHVFNGLYMISVVGSRAPPVISQSSYAKAPFLGEILTWPGPHSRHRSASGWYFERMKTCLEPQASDGVGNSSHWNKNETAINQQMHAIADSHSCFVCSCVAILKLKLWRCKATPLEFGGKQLHFASCGCLHIRWNFAHAAKKFTPFNGSDIPDLGEGNKP